MAKLPAKRTPSSENNRIAGVLWHCQACGQLITEDATRPFPSFVGHKPTCPDPYRQQRVTLRRGM